MELKAAEFNNKGMFQDTSISKASNEFAYENHNIRITAVGDKTLFSVTNERGPVEKHTYTYTGLKSNRVYYDETKHLIVTEYPPESRVSITIYEYRKDGGALTRNRTLGLLPINPLMSQDDLERIEIQVSSSTKQDDYYVYYGSLDETPVGVEVVETSIEGIYLGHCITNNYLVLFTHDDSYDRIYRLYYENDRFIVFKLFEGNLNFSLDNPIETLFYYESEKIQKVYWVDGINQTRLINIASEKEYTNSNIFNFNTSVSNFPTVTIEKDYTGNGIFPSGTIQYFITYYNKFFSETSIIGNSDIVYLTMSDRGAKADETIGCNINIKISNIDTSFEYIRVYSAKRTSIDGPVEFNLVGDYTISADSTTVVDTNTNQSTLDSTMLYYIGGEQFVCSTIAEKDNTAFFGNITLKEDNVAIIEEYISTNLINFNNGIYEAKNIEFGLIKEIASYPKYSTPVDFQLNNTNIKGFKKGEIYRFAIQFQYPTGHWTSPIWIGDKKCTLSPDDILLDDGKTYSRRIVQASFNWDEGLNNYTSSYSNYRILIVEPTYNDRSVLAQGVLCPTIFNLNERTDGNIYATSSYIMRPMNSNVAVENLQILGLDRNAEIQNMQPTRLFEKGIRVEYTEPPLITGNYVSSCDLYIVMVNTPVTAVEGSSGLFEKAGLYVTLCLCGIIDAIGECQTPYSASYKLVIGNDTDYTDYGKYKEVRRWLLSLNLEFLSRQIDLTDYASWFEFINMMYNSDKSIGKFKRTGDQVGNGASNNYSYILAGIPCRIKIKPNYYIDSSIVTFHSPDIELLPNNIQENIKLNIVGYSKTTSTNDFNFTVSEVGIADFAGQYKPADANRNVLISEFAYNDYGYKKYSKDIDTTTLEFYNVYMWQKTGSIIGYGSGCTGALTDKPAKLESKIFANKIKCNKTEFVDLSKHNIIGLKKVDISDTLVKLPISNNKEIYYSGNIDTLFTTDDEYFIYTKTSDYELGTKDPVRIRYKSPLHIVMSLGNEDKLDVLPTVKNQENLFDIFSFYNTKEKEGDGYTITEGIPNSSILPWDLSLAYSSLYENQIGLDITEDEPTLFIAELTRELDYSTLYGGTTEQAFKVASWVPASGAFSVGETASNIEGDTYFQRWECLKTVPYAEGDENSVVDITSFMVETRRNIDGRCDINRDTEHILNVRETNFNLFNDAYNQSNNLFKYNILDEKFSLNKFSNQIAWSLTKQPSENIDTWSNVTLQSTLQLNGRYGSINKLINANNALLAFQDNAVATINYNNRTQLSTEQGVPVEIANSGKVNGFTYSTTTSGCKNKWSICQATSGLYYIDSNNKSLYSISKDGINDVAKNYGMSLWFKEKLTPDIWNPINKGYIVSYDNLTKDIYVTNEDNCIVYNEEIGAFTSFMPYLDTFMFNLEGQSFYFNIRDKIRLANMFNGEFNTDLDGNIFDYSMTYRVNSSPYEDKIFTNIDYIADITKADSPIDMPDIITSEKPFDTLEVWNEFQYGKANLITKATTSNLKKKFRVWRVDIPRDENSRYKMDRIRNPWVYVKVSNTPLNKDKLVFHNMSIKFYT